MGKQQQGFTLVELMVAVAVVGTLAIVAIPHFTAQAAKGKSSEAKLQLEKLAHNAVLYFQDHRKFPQGTAAVLPGDDGTACSESDHRFAASMAWSGDPMWRAMDFGIEEASRFSYHYEATSEKSARAWAVADLGCSGEQVTYEVILEGRGTGNVEWVLIDPTSAVAPTIPQPDTDTSDDEPEDTDSGSGSGSSTGGSTGGSTGSSSGSSSGSTGSSTGSSSGSSTGTGSSSGTSAGSGSTGSTSTGSSSTGSTSTGSTSTGSSSTGSTSTGSTSTGTTSTGGTSSSSTSSSSTSTNNGNGSGGNGGGNSGSTSNSCGGSGTTVVTCPAGYTLNLANCTCKKNGK